MSEDGDDSRKREKSQRAKSDQAVSAEEPFDFQLGISESEGAADALDNGEESGLEIDDRQSADIRQIFGTAFPQYLQPVEELVDQILSGKGDAESLGALTGTLSSLMTASSRMGFDNVHDLLRQLHATASGLDSDALSSPSTEIREAIVGNLMDLKEVAQEMAGQALLEQGGRSKTIFSALQGKEGVDKDVLRRLTSAGLVSVDQLLMAKPEEIAVVSGIDIGSVHHILELLSRDDQLGERSQQRPAGAGPPRTAVVSLFPAGKTAPAVPSEVDSLHDNVLRKLRVEVEVEASVEEIKKRIRELRSLISEHRVRLRSLEQSNRPKSKEVRKLEQNLADQVETLVKRRSERDALAQRCSFSQEAVRQREARLVMLHEQRHNLGGKTARLGHEVGGLVEMLGHVRRSIAKRRPG